MLVERNYKECVGPNFRVAGNRVEDILYKAFARIVFLEIGVICAICG
jgi:hypothetical protein